MMFIFITLLAYALAEPPVGAGYRSSRPNHGHHGLGNQRSLAEDYETPAIGARSGYTTEARSFPYDQSRSAPSQEYGPPDVRTGVSQEFGLPNKARSSFSEQYKPSRTRSGLSQEYGTPNTGSGLSQEYGTPNTRSGVSQEFGTPNARTGISQKYGLPNSRSQYSSSSYNTGTDYNQDYSIASARLSQEYGTPQFRTGSADYESDIPSDSYGTPLQRSGPSEEYGVPSQRNLGQPPSQKYGQPNFRNVQSFSPNALSKSRYTSSGRFNKGSASSRTTPSDFVSRTQNGALRSSYSVPSARNIDSYLPQSKSISATYLPSSRSASQNALPEGRGLSTEYSAPSARGSNTYASSFDTGRSSPSIEYGTPSTRESMPSEQYGVPEQYDSLSSQGYSYARNALDELLNQEPANYDFGYKVSDYITGSDFGHTESRQDNRAEGSYFVVLPDGTKQVVDYEADERGFKPRISVEPAGSRSGYDDNAADLTRSDDAPY